MALGAVGGTGSGGWHRERWVAPGKVGGTGKGGWHRERWVAPGAVGGTGKGGWYWERWVAPGAENGGGTGSDCIAKKKPTEEQPQCRSSVGLSCVSRTDSARRVLKPPFLSRHRQVATAGANFPRRGWLATSHCLPKHRTTAMQRTSRICITYATEKIGVIATIRPTKNRHKQ